MCKGNIMNETTETGLGILISGGVITALSTVGNVATGLGTLGTVLLPVGVVIAALGIYQTSRKTFTPTEPAPSTK